MTDKQIIIDGIDVSECKYFSKYQKIVRNNECIVDIQNACVEETKTKPCRQKHNCYFKNWQRKEQECEELKHDNGYEVGALEKTIDNLKAENEGLKKQLESTKGLVTVGNKQLEECLLKLQKYKDNEQQEKEIKKLYKKFAGSSLIEKKKSL